MVFGNQAEAFQEEIGKMINLCFQDKLQGCSSGINTHFFIDKTDLFFSTLSDEFFNSAYAKISMYHQKLKWTPEEFSQ